MKTNKINEKWYQRGQTPMVSFLSDGRTVDGHATDMRRTCDGHATDIGRTCDGHVTNMNRTSIEHESNIERTCAFPVDNEKQYQRGQTPMVSFRVKYGLNTGEIRVNYGFARQFVYRVAAMLLMLVTMSVGQVWGANSVVTKNLTEATGTSPYTWTFGSAQSVNSTDIYVEVGSASASGTIGVTCNSTRSDRPFKVGDKTGSTSYTVNSYTADVENSILFTSSYVFLENDKYYIRIYSDGKDAKVSKITLMLGSSTKTVYLDLSSFTNWENDGAGFRVWDGTDNHNFTKVNTDCTNDHLYSAEVCAGKNQLWFKRGDAAHTTDYAGNEATSDTYATNNAMRITGWGAGTPFVYSAPSFSVTYKANGGTGADVVEGGIACDGSHTVKAANTFSRTNWSFLKWSDQHGNSYQPGDNISPSENLTLWAHWETWSVYGNFADGTGWSDYYFENGTIAIEMAAAVTRSFKIKHQQTDVATAWYGNSGTMTSSNCTNWDFSTSAGDCEITSTIAGDYRFTLVNNTPRISVTYPVQKYTITYAANGGSGTMTDSNSPYAAGTQVTLKSNTFTAPTGKQFASWLVKDASDNTVAVAAGKFTMPSSNVTVIAQWEDAAPAPTPCFTMPDVNSKPSSLASISVTGGTLSDVSTDASKAATMDNKGLKFGGNATRIKVTLTSASIVAGTTITLTYTSAYSDGTVSGIALLNGNAEHKVINKSDIPGDAKKGSVSHTFTAAEAEFYSTEFIITRNDAGKSVILTGITVSNCGGAPTTYTITYNKGANGTGDAIANGQKTDGVNFTLSSSTYSRDGYTQTGWSLTDGGAKTYDLGGTYSTDADLTLYPFWEEDVCVPSTFTLKHGSDVMGTFVATGNANEYSVVVEFTNDNMNNQYIVDNCGNRYGNGQLNADNCLVLTEGETATYNTGGASQNKHWKFTFNSETKSLCLDAKAEEDKTYSITYECDGATSGCPANVASTKTLPNPLATPVKTGYTFDGWFTNSDKTEAAVAGATLTANVTLYAEWTEDSPVPTTCFSMVVKNQSTAEKNIDLSVGKDLESLSGGSVSQSGLKSNTTDKGLQLDNNADYIEITLSDATLAQGSKIIVTYYNGTANQGVGFGPSTSYPSWIAGTNCLKNSTTGAHVDQEFTVPAGSPLIGKSTFYVFRAGGSSVYLSKLSVTGCGTATYTVTYDGNGATGGTAPVDATEYTSGADVTVLGNTGSLVRTGYTFSGWNTKANGSGEDYAEGGTISGIDADVTLYAKWSAKTTTVTIDANAANHGSTAPDAFTATVGQALPAFTAATGEANYSLKGYYTAAVGGNLVINADGTLVASVAGYTDANKKWAHDDAAVTLYAQYEKVNTACASVVVNYSKNGGYADAVVPGDYEFAAGEVTASACSVVAGHIDHDKNRQLLIERGNGFKFLSGKIYLKVTFTTALAEGDRIEITATNDAHEFYLTANNTTYPTSGNKITSGQSYTVEEDDGLIGSKELYIWRGKGETMYLRTIDRICSTGCKKPNLAYATATVSKQDGDAAFTNTLTNTNGVDVVYSSSNTAVATVNASNGQVSIVGGGTTTIKATAAEQTKGGTTYCEREVSYVLNVCATTAITTQPAGETVGRGDNHTLSVVATGTNLSYQWYSCATENGTYAEIKGATNASYTFAALGERWYMCKITNGCGNVTESSKAHIELSKGTPTFTWTVAETVYQGQQVPFTVQTNSDATPNVSLVTANGNSLQNVTVNGNTITGTLVVNTANYTSITLRVTTDATSNFDAGSDDKEIEISEECPSAGTEVVYSFQVNSSTQNVTTAQTVVGGTATLGNISSDRLSTSSYTASGYAYKLDANPAADNTKNVLVNLNTALQAGDIITISGFASAVNEGSHFLLSADKAANTVYAELPITVTKNVEQQLQFEVTDAATGAGAMSFYISRQTSSVFLSGVTVTSSGKVGSLQWEDSELGDGDVVVKKTGDANFTNVAIATSAGTITYSTSNSSVADVNSSTGEVTIGTTGRATITASLAENGCYSAQTITYIVEVQSDCTAPTITAQPVDADYKVGDVATALSVTASGTNLTYQWYSNTTKSNENGTLLSGKTSDTYTPATATKGTYYYYCVVTSQTYCATVSDVATITVTKTCGEREAPMIKVISHTGTELCWQTITLKAFAQDGTSDLDGGSYVWYKDDEVIVGQISNTLVVNETGVYYVEHVVDDCPMESSNRAYVEHKDAMAQRLTPFQYYHAYKVDDGGNHVDWTYSDQMKDRHLFAVRGLSEVGGEKYVVNASLKQDAGDASPADRTTEVRAMLDKVQSTTDASVDTLMIDLNKLASLNMVVGNELVISVAPYNCHGTAEAAQSITIYVIDEKPALAFIVAGADGEGTKTKKQLVVGGDFLSGYNKADLKKQTALTTVSEEELPLYTALKANFQVTPVNGYAPFNKLNYEPFDLVFLTDFVKTDGSGDASAAKAKVNDLGQLVDYRPLFSTKCHMSGIDNWKKVGFTANPIAPKQTQLHMNIVCYAHPMFEGMATDGINIFQDYEEQNETVFKMISDGGYDKGKGVQGFELSAAENFVIVAQTHNDAHGEVVPENPHMLQPVVGGEDKILVASCERQANVEARMILLSLNADATSKLTTAGIDVIVRSLNYLMEIRQIKVTDCHFEFDDATGDHKWSTAGNWAPRHSVLPTKNVNVRIAKNCTVDVPTAVAGGMKIMDGVTVTINADAALQLTGMARHLEDGELSPTGAGELIVLADADGSGAFIHGDEAGQTGATVDFYSISGNALKADGSANDVDQIQWQWMTTPFAYNQASTNYDGAWMYAYTNSTHKWNPVVNTYSMMYAFRGYEITQDTRTEPAHTYTMTGTLASTADQELPLYSGLNLIGNSWTAPINIEAMTAADFENGVATIVMFNTGNDGDGSGEVSLVESRQASTYVSIPVSASIAIPEFKVIPAMQAFEVKATADGTLHLDYDRIVRKSGAVDIKPMRAPQRNAAADADLGNGVDERLRISVRGSRYSDFLYLLRHPEMTDGFDNGWDGEKEYSSNDNIPAFYVENAAGDWQVSTQPMLAGTTFGFYKGEDTHYTMYFDYVGEEELWLYDATTNIYTAVETGNTYEFISTFYSPDYEPERRFVLTNYNPNAPQDPGIATGVDDVSPDSGPRKLILDDKLFILNNGRLYDATGRLAY